MVEENEGWKEKKFQEKLIQLFKLVNIDFFEYIIENAEGKNLPLIRDEKFIDVRPEYPTFSGDAGSRPDIYLETNKGKCLVFELKPDKNYDETQLINHDNNMKKWAEENKKEYLATILIANLDSENDKITFPSSTIKWIGWDIVYRALEDLKINKLDPEIRSSIDRILSEIPLAKLNTELKKSLLGEAEDSQLYQALKLSILVSELKEQLYLQMNLEDILKKYEPITGDESHKVFSDKSNILFKSIEKAIRNEFEKDDYVLRIEASEYLDYITIHLSDWTGYIDVDFRDLKNKSEDKIKVILYLKSGKKYSLLKTLVTLYDENRTEFDNILQNLTSEGAEVYAKFGSGEKIDVSSKDGINEVRDRTFMPIYVEKTVSVFNKERDIINNNIIETVKRFLEVFKTLFDKLKKTATPEEIAEDIGEVK
ncbi:hypothetical protein [Palaeococcus sp. (in: euryarchaeotes)]